MPKDSLQATLRNAQRLQEMISLLANTEGASACAGWLNHIIDEVISKQSKADPFFGYYLLKNLSAHIKNKLLDRPGPKPAFENQFEEHEIQRLQPKKH